MLQLILMAVFVGSCGVLWRIGGSGGGLKWVRRFIVPLIIVLPSILNQSWIAVSAYLPLTFAFSLGYGKSSSLRKWLKEPHLVHGFCGFAYALAALPILWGAWNAFIFHMIFCIAGAIMCGLCMEIKGFEWLRTKEEFFIGLMVSLIPIVQSI